jgi:hypothetical protein
MYLLFVKRISSNIKIATGLNLFAKRILKICLRIRLDHRVIIKNMNENRVPIVPDSERNFDCYTQNRHTGLLQLYVRLETRRLKQQDLDLDSKFPGESSLTSPFLRTRLGIGRSATFVTVRRCTSCTTNSSAFARLVALLLGHA